MRNFEIKYNSHYSGLGIKSIEIKTLSIFERSEKLFQYIYFNPKYKKCMLSSFILKKDCYKLCSNILNYTQIFGKTLLKAPI